jgi:glycogen debranching enzyme
MFEILPPDNMLDLQRLRRPGRGIRTSDGRMYGGSSNIWGRDMAITAIDLIDIDPKISEEAIITLSELQGTDFNLHNGEKPGRIHTEHRDIYDKNTLGIFGKIGLSLASKILWRNNWRSYTNYFSSDTTPLFIKLVYEYSLKHPEILDQEITRKNQHKDTIRFCVIKAAEYIAHSANDEGLIKIKENTLAGNQFRYWRDSPSSYRDENSRLPNILDEMVILDIQALCAEALNLAAKIATHTEPEKAAEWKNISKKIKKVTISNFWMIDQNYFAYAMDKSKRGHMKLLRTIQSNAAWLLNTDFFDDIEPDDKQKYLTGIISRLFSDEFLTDAGIRCRSKKYMHDQKYQDYHGAWVSWPVESFMFARGLRRQGFIKLAEQIEARIINVIDICGVNYEFFVADENGHILLNPKRLLHFGYRPVALEILPECTIAWTVTASLIIKKQLQEKQNLQQQDEDQNSWKWQLENDILNKIRNYSNYLTSDELDHYIKSEPNLYIDRVRGFWQSAKSITKDVGPKIIKSIINRK